jgi:hypothetical protein
MELETRLNKMTLLLRRSENYYVCFHKAFDFKMPKHINSERCHELQVFTQYPLGTSQNLMAQDILVWVYITFYRFRINEIKVS